MSKINQEEYELLKGLDEEWKWIARDSDTILWVYEKEPRKYENCWDELSGHCEIVDSDSFRFIQWSDSEPYNIQELIREYEWAQLNEKYPPVRESEGTEVKSKQDLVEKWELAIESAEFYGKGKEKELISYMKDFVSDLKQLNEPEATLDRAFEKVAESYPMTKKEICRHLERLVAYGGKVTYGEPETLSQEWIDDHKVARIDNLRKMTTYDVVSVDKLKDLLVPKQEEVDQAYKAGYETGKQHTFYKGYLEGLADKESINPERSPEVDQHKELLDELNDLYARKNQDYGNSFDESLDEDGLLVLKIRLGDKYKRFNTLINQKNEVVDESMRDTLIDLANYALMGVMWMDNQEED